VDKMDQIDENEIPKVAQEYLLEVAMGNLFNLVLDNYQGYNQLPMVNANQQEITNNLNVPEGWKPDQHTIEYISLILSTTIHETDEIIQAEFIPTMLNQINNLTKKDGDNYQLTEDQLTNLVHHNTASSLGIIDSQLGGKLFAMKYFVSIQDDKNKIEIIHDALEQFNNKDITREKLVEIVKPIEEEMTQMYKQTYEDVISENDKQLIN